MPPSIFTLNGHDCHYPEQLYNEFSRLGIDTSDWYFQANQFIQNRGTTPSWGLLLCSQDSVDNSSDKKLIVHFGIKQRFPSITFPIEIEWSKKLAGHASLQTKGYNLVKVVDERYALNELVGKRFNHVIDYISPPPNANPDVKGRFVYHPKSLKQGQSSLEPYTWRELVEECWKIPSGAQLNFSEFGNFPTYTPQDLDWRETTRKDALDMLLQWLGATIEFDVGNQGWNFIPVEDNPDFSNYSKICAADNWLETKEPGEATPKAIKFYFAKIDQSNNDVEPYQVIEKTPPGFNVNKQTLHLRLPAHYAADFKSPNLPQEIADDFIGRAAKRWAQFPPQEKTFLGYLPIHPNGKIERVTYYQYHDKCCTHVQSVLKQQWLITPKAIDGETVSHVFGIVMTGVLPITPYFLVTPLAVIAGRKPEGINALKVINRHQQAYQPGDKIDIYQRTDDEFWSTGKTGGEGGDRVVRFELFEDMDSQDLARRAYLLDIQGQRIFIADAQPFLISVLNSEHKYQGYAQYNDPVYGEQAGYMGSALSLSYTAFGLDQYYIINMEQVARFIEGYMPGEESVDGKWDYIPGQGYGYINPSTWYWDGRPPKTISHTFGESAGSETLDVIRFIDNVKVAGRLIGGSKVKLIWDEVAKIYTLWSFGKSETETDLKRGFLIKDIAAARLLLFQDAGGIDANDITYDFSDSWEEQAVIIAEQERDDNTGEVINRYRTKYSDATRTKPIIVAGVNLLDSPLRGSKEEPGWVLGRMIKIWGYNEDGEEGEIDAFEIIRDDINITKGWEKGKAQILFKPAGSREATLGGRKCDQ